MSQDLVDNIYGFNTSAERVVDAVSIRRTALTRMLVSNGADASKEDHQGRTAADLAQEGDMDELVFILSIANHPDAETRRQGRQVLKYLDGSNYESAAELVLSWGNLDLYELMLAGCSLGEHDGELCVPGYWGGHEQYILHLINNAPSGVSIDASINRDNIRRLKISFRLGRLGVISHLKNLENLSVMEGLDDLKGISKHNKLKKLTLHDCPSLDECREIGQLQGLEYLEIRSCEPLQHLMLISRLSGLKVLKLCWNKHFRDISRVALLRKLKVLEIESGDGINGLESIGKLEGLESLAIRSPRLESLGSWVKGLVNLEKICLNCENVVSIDGLECLSKLKTVNLSQCSSLPAESLRPFAGKAFDSFDPPYTLWNEWNEMNGADD